MSLLFRQEVIEAQACRMGGVITIARPISSWIFVFGASLIPVGILAYLFLGTYTKRITVNGSLQPTQGAIRIQSPTAGILVERRVEEGQIVKKGEILFVFADERRSITHGQHAKLSDLRASSLNQRRKSLERAVDAEGRLAAQILQSYRDKISNLHLELARNQEEINLQRHRVEAALKILERYRLLAIDRLVSEVTLQEKEDQANLQRAQLLSMQRQRNQIVSSIAIAEDELDQAPSRTTSRLAELDGTAAELMQEIAEIETRDKFAVTAPMDGVVTAITTQLGQSSVGQAIATVLPSGGELVAHLFAPSRAVGFVQAGQTVRLRYQAYPYQKYGQHAGSVIEVSRSPVQPGDIPGVLPIGVQEGTYRITVRLATQNLSLNDRTLSLMPGMILDGDIAQEKRRLIEWVIEPIWALRNQVS